jgi:hypothetical protein
MLSLGINIWFRAILGRASAPGTPTGNGTMDFSIATGDDTGLLVLLEDI